jgi:ankyrin repeat protein
MGGHTESVVEMIPYITVAEDLEDALCWAAQGGHSQLVAALLDNSSVSPDGRLQVRHESVSVTTGGQTPLMLAAKSLDPATVRILLDKGADATKSSSRDMNKYWRPYSPWQPRPQANTALHSLVKANITKESESAAKEILIMLLASGADLEARDHEGNTPLLSTIGGGYSSSVSLISMNMLIAAGANPLAADNKGGTLLHKACETSFETDAVKRLLELGANHSQRRFSDGATPLHSAVANIHCSDAMIKLLVSHGAYVNVRDAQGNTPLLCAVKDSSIREEQTVGALLDLKADVNLQNDLGQTCLHLFRFSTASYDNNEAKLKNLINTGANLELCDREGKTVLLHTITESGENKVNALLQYSSSLLTARTYREGKSALHLTCHSRDPLKMIQMLVDHGANPTWVDNNGNTLLHEVATRFGGFAEDIALVEKLIELGVPIRALNWQRRTAWHILRPFDAVNDSSRDKASRQGMFSVLLRHDPDIDLNAKDIDGYTPLHLAAASSEAQTFNLLQAGACISAKAFNLRTPLHCAARARKSNILAMLLDHANEAATSDQALDVDAKDKGDRTPLHDACRSGRPESVRILLDHGACADQPYDRPASAFVDSGSPLMACTEFVQEDKLWSCLRSGTAPLDEFRPTMLKSGHRQSFQEDKEQHDTVRIGPIASMLLETGARDQYALQAAVKAKSTALVAAFREKTPSTSRGL